MFVGVDANDLVPGAKYAMDIGFSECKYSTGMFRCHESGHTLWWYYTKDYSGVKHINTYNTLRDMKNKNYSQFFTFVSQIEKIQQAMEQRALDKILKRLVNDDFTW